MRPVSSVDTRDSLPDWGSGSQVKCPGTLTKDGQLAAPRSA